MTSAGRLEAALRTDQGQTRDHNEDFVACYEPAGPEDEQRHGWLYLVADGVGGAEAGEVASRYAGQRVIHHYLQEADQTDTEERLQAAVDRSNRDLRRLIGKQTKRSRMATTLVAAVIRQDEVTIANVGDSRAYHWRGGALRQVTRDQSLVAELLEKGAITEEEAANHPRRNVILHSLGSESEAKIDLFHVRVANGDRIVLCSDGLTRHVSDEEIAALNGRLDPTHAADDLIALANERGGEDNISVAIVRFGEQPGSGEGETAATAIAGTSSADKALRFYTLFLALAEIALIFYTWLLIVG